MKSVTETEPHLPTEHLDNYGLPKKLGVKEKNIGPWRLLSCGQRVLMGAEEIAQLSHLIREWRRHFAGGVKKTLIQRHVQHLFHGRDLGAHSILIRADYFWKPQYGVQLCEIEERPAGKAVSAELNAQFRALLMRIFGKVERVFKKPLAFCISGGRMGDSDDITFIEQYRWPGDPETGFHPRNIKVVHGLPSLEELERYVWWVRALRNEEAYFALEPHALSTISQEGDKGYGIPMGLWFPIGANWRSVLPLESGCVLKPRYGSRFEHSIIVQTLSRKPGDTRGKLDSGIHGFSAARKAIESGSVAYWQPFYPPERAPFLGGTNYGLLRRAYFGMDLDIGDYIPLGGLWVAHNTARIHGASNALFGPLQLPS